MSFESTVLHPEQFLSRVKESSLKVLAADQLWPYEGKDNPWHKQLLDSMMGVPQTEYEACFFLFALVVLLKPRIVVETGTGTGFATRALGHGCKANGIGLVYSCDLDETLVSHARDLCQHLPVEVRHGPSVETLPELATCDLLYADASRATTAWELDRLKLGAFAAVSNTREAPILQATQACREHLNLHVIPRGLALVRK